MQHRRSTGLYCRPQRTGQAMVEFIVALVAALVVIAALAQIGAIGRLHSALMNNARRNAGALALLDTQTLAGPDYILNRTPGNDGARYTRDDGFLAASAADFSGHVIQYAHPADLGARRPGNAISGLDGNPFPQLTFGLVYGRDAQTTNLMPIVRHLFYAADEIEVEHEVYMTWTRGIY
jgi:hypothetical protein